MYLMLGALIGALAAVAYQQWDARRKERVAKEHVVELVKAIANAQAAAAIAIPRLRRRLEIEGTEHEGLQASLLHAWGIQKEHVQDVASISGPVKLEETSEGLMDCLAMCFCQSKTRGVEINDLLKTGNLSEGKRLYFVLSEPELGKPTITALVS